MIINALGNSFIRRAASVAAVIATSAVYAAIVFGSTGGAVAQESPISPGPTPEGGVASNWSYMPIIMKNASQYTYYPPTTIPIVLSCGDDPCARGDFYRSLVSNTITILNPLAGWASSGCTCGLMDAQARGAAFGTIIGMGVKIVGRIFSTIGNVIGQSLAMLMQFWELATADAEEYSVNCTADMELFCFGLAAVVALDDIGGGIVMILTLLLVSVASIYLILWVANEIREVMQPGSGGDD